MSGFLDTAAPVGQQTLDAFFQGAAATREQREHGSQHSEMPTLGDWVEGSGGPVELSLGDWHPSQPSGTETWECGACTYADNALGVPCCAVCGRTRGVPWAAAAEEEEGLVRCDKCGRMVAQEDGVEHADWHLAVELQRDEERARPSAKAGKRTQQTTIDSFLVASGLGTKRRNNS